jgi:hypothetical protein
MAQMYKYLKGKYGENFYKETSTKVANYLVGITNKGYFPSDEEFFRELTTRDMYQNRNIKYILTKIEKGYQGKEIVNLDLLSVEHVMPQNLSDEWVKEINNPDYEKNHAEKVNKIGNLTLTAYNSEMSNKLFKEKQKNIDFSRLTLNNYFKNISEWNFEKIDNRNEYIAKLILSIWKYPKIDKASDISKRDVLLLNDDDFDYSGTKPLGIKISSHEIRSNSWTELYAIIIKYLYENYRESIIEIVKNDPVASYILLSHSHDGTLSVRAGFSEVRLWCGNQLSRALKSKTSKLLKMKHTRGLKMTMDKVQHIMDVAKQEFIATTEQYKFLASKNVNKKDL